jgi:Carboxypeptidase regulatory-like domain
LSNFNRGSSALVVAGSILLGFVGLVPCTSVAQESADSTIHSKTLPDSPSVAQSATQSGVVATQAAAGTITGTVMDTNRDVLQGAPLRVVGKSGSALRSIESGIDGQFTLSGLPPDTYRVIVSAPDMREFTSSEISLSAGEFKILPPIILSVATVATSVTVVDKEELAEQQVQIAVHQRIGGVIPNFYSSYDWNAPPMQAKQKFKLSFRSLIDPVSLLSVAGIAGAEQYRNIFPAYGSGIEGYGKRYGAALANHASSALLSRAVFPSIFHQDPRYFYKGTGSVRSRMLYAISAAFMTRGDNGRWEPNYSHLMGSFSAAAISNLYYPRSDRGASLVMLNGLASTGGDIIANIIREFVLKGITSDIPTDAQRSKRASR